MKARLKQLLQFKELTIQTTPNGFLPNLPLNGKWLEELGFTVGLGVGARFENSCLTLTVGGADLQVESRMIRKRPRTHLIINALWLKKYGFKVGDKVGLTLEHGQIQIQKINKYTIAEQSA